LEVAAISLVVSAASLFTVRPAATPEEVHVDPLSVVNTTFGLPDVTAQNRLVFRITAGYCPGNDPPVKVFELVQELPPLVE
jgi:hypothetical protein